MNTLRESYKAYEEAFKNEVKEENISLRKQIKRLVQRQEFLSREVDSLNMRIANKIRYTQDNLKTLRRIG